MKQQLKNTSKRSMIKTVSCHINCHVYQVPDHRYNLHTGIDGLELDWYDLVLYKSQKFNQSNRKFALLVSTKIWNIMFLDF